MIKKVLQTKLGSALAVAAAVVSIGTVATVSAAHQPPGTGKAAGTRRPVRPGGKTQRFTTKGLRVMK